MVLNRDRQALVLGIDRRSFGDRPALEDPFHLQAEIVVQVRGLVLLYHKDEVGGRWSASCWFRRFMEPAFLFVFGKGHGHLNKKRMRELGGADFAPVPVSNKKCAL